MKSLLKTKVDIRVLAATLMILGVLWWYTLVTGIQKGGISGLDLPAAVLVLCFFFGGPFLAFALCVAHAAEPRKHPYWVYSAVVIAASPWAPVVLWLWFEAIPNR